ncbi:MAG: MotA/TolQ/ExbB proton channel family protein [Comamonas sp.]|nr:MotA/TolQ/ExbB proton channel family protein [Comamonas sp.]
MLSLIQAAGWPIWPLIACSILALALIVERFVSLRSSKILPAHLLDEAIAVTQQGHLKDMDEQVLEQLAQSSTLGTILAQSLGTLKRTPAASQEMLQEQMQTAGRAAAHGLERYLGALATIASAAPLLGLLGTVIGMIEIFGSQAGAGAVGTGNPAQLAHGISVALYNTAFGLMVAIPALIFWRYFRARVDSYLLQLELAGEQFLNHIKHQRALAQR